jgi:hypothetical protein
MSSSYNNHFAFGTFPVLRSYVQKSEYVSKVAAFQLTRPFTEVVQLSHLRDVHLILYYNKQLFREFVKELFLRHFPTIHKFGLPVYPPTARLSGQLPASHLALPLAQMASHLLKIIDGTVHPRSQCLYLAIFRNDVPWTRSWKIHLWWPLWVNKNISWSLLRTKHLS